MKRILLLCAVAGALAIPATISAASATDGTLSVKRGRGLIVLKLRGTVIGSMANGSVRIRDFTPFDGQSPQFRHCKVHRVSASTTVCTGRKLSFRALDGHYAVRTKGSGIFLSAVGRGTVMMDGADFPTTSDGVMSFDGGPYQPIPYIPTNYTLGSTPPSRN
jgi:hypothetical protein